MTSISRPNARVEFANALRGLAALAVLVSHYLGIFWLQRDVTATLTNAPVLSVDSFGTPLYVRLLHPLQEVDWGPFGVGLFFLVSGFVIPFSIDRYNRRAFIVGRIVRIYPTYAAGLTLSIAAVYLSGYYFGRDFPYTASEVVFHYILGIRDLASSRSIDGIVWTLEIEVHFYALCVVAAAWLRRGSMSLAFVPVGLCGASLLLGPHMADWALHDARTYHVAHVVTLNAQFLIYMCIGVAIHLHHRSELSSTALPFVIAMLFGLFSLSWHSTHPDFFYQVWSYGLSLAVFIVAAVSADRWARTRVLSFFADISYPLYVVHGVAGYVGLRLLLDEGATPGMAVAITTMGAIGLAWLVHRVIETPTRHWGQSLARRMSSEAMIGKQPATRAAGE